MMKANQKKIISNQMITKKKRTQKIIKRKNLKVKKRKNQLKMMRKKIKKMK